MKSPALKSRAGKRGEWDGEYLARLPLRLATRVSFRPYYASIGCFLTRRRRRPTKKAGRIWSMKARSVSGLLGMIVAIVLVILGRALYKQLSLPLALTMTAIVVGIAALVKRRNPAPAEESKDADEKF